MVNRLSNYKIWRYLTLILFILYVTSGVGGSLDAQADISLTAPLSSKDVQHYKEIYALQEIGAWDEADRLISSLKNPILIGYIQFQRYMHPNKYRSSFQELRQWLLEYRDHDGATRIYRLAKRRQVAGLPAPLSSQSITINPLLLRKVTNEDQPPKINPSQKKRIVAYSRAAARERRSIIRQVQNGYVTRSLKRLEQPKIRKLFSNAALADLMGILARGYYRYHKDAQAMEMAKRATALDATSTEARWWAGLSAWRQEAYRDAADFFEAMTLTETDEERHDAAAFWASRAWLRAGHPQKVQPLLNRVSANSHNFYGLLALHAAGRTPAYDWSMPAIDQKMIALLSKEQVIQRVLALRQIGLLPIALNLFDRIVPKFSDEALYALLGIFEQAQFADLTYKVARQLKERELPVPQAAYYPLGDWQANQGFHLDQALLHAFIRQESRFNPKAKSRAGATGLMQIMPATARYISRITDFPYDSQQQLIMPAFNLALGQNYLRYLMTISEIEGNLFFVAVGYNAGPGNLRQWQEAFDYNGDPLLFIETIPSLETRNYVEHILANLWIYRYRLGQPTPSLWHLLATSWPIYNDLERRTIAIDTKIEGSF